MGGHKAAQGSLWRRTCFSQLRSSVLFFFLLISILLASQPFPHFVIQSLTDALSVCVCTRPQGWHGTSTIWTPTPSTSDANDLYLARGSSAKPLNVRLRSRWKDCCFSKVSLLVCGKVPASFSRCPHLVPLKGF